MPSTSPRPKKVEYSPSGANNFIVRWIYTLIFVIITKETVGDILHAEAFGMHVIVINSRKIAEDLLEKRADKYDDRPEIPIAKLYGCSS